MIAATSVALSDYAQTVYAVENDISDGTAYVLERRAKMFEEWAVEATANGQPWHEARRAAIDAASITDWMLSCCLRDLRSRYAPSTLRNARADWITLLRSAARDGIAVRPKKVRRVKKPKPDPKAYTPEQAERLIATLFATPGTFPDGTPRGLMLGCIGLVAWDTGLRLGDLRRLEQGDFQSTGVVAIKQKKTGEMVISAVYADTLAIVRRLGDNPCRSPVEKRAFYRWWAKAVAAASVPHLGGLHALRRSGATDVARTQPGAETRFLGHTTPSADVNYIDRAILETSPIKPTQLKWRVDPQQTLFD